MLLNQTASVYSPLVRLIGASWTDGQSTERGDVMSFAFQGAAVTLYGSVGGGASTFDVTVDGGPVKTISNLLASVEPAPLFSSELLSQGMHVLQVTNQRPTTATGTDGILTLSTVEWAMDLPDGTASQIIDNMDQNPSLEFRPTPSYWQNGVCTSAYFKADCHLTQSASASMTYTFNGSAISVFGGTNKDHGNYTVQIDGGSLMRYTGYTPTLQVRQLIAHAVLSPPNAQHTITIANKPLNASFSNFDIDFFQVFGDPASLKTSTSVGSTSVSGRPGIGADTTKPSGSSNLPVILGCIIGALAAILIIVFLWWWRSRRSRSSLTKQKFAPDPWSPHTSESAWTAATAEQMALIGSAGSSQTHQFQDYAWQAMDARKRDANLRIADTQPSLYTSSGPLSSNLQPTPALYHTPSRQTRHTEESSIPGPAREEVDAGRIPLPGGEEPVPPSYQKIDFSRRTKTQRNQPGL